MFAADSPFTVYCRGCYYSDRWDPYQYGVPYDASRPFLEQFAELFRRVPKTATITSGSSGSNINSEYQNWAGNNSNCYLVFNSGQNEMLMYSRGMRQCRDTLDCYYGINAELCYESVNVHDSSRVRYSDNVRNCLDSWFLRDCTGCTNCFGCVNLRYKDYYFFNEPLSKEAYEQRVSVIVGSFARLEEMKKTFHAFSASHPFRANHNMKSEDCEGDYIVDSKNCQHSFEVDKGENCSYHYFTKTAKDASDCIGFGYNSELLYECVATGYSHHMIGCMYAEESSDLEYCHSMRSCMSCIGCDGLTKTNCAILNTVYPEDEYRAQRESIIASMKSDGSWGSYFPLSLAPFAFNETIARDYYPLSKEDACAQGYVWKDVLPETTGKETMGLERIPDTIDDVPESIVKEVLACQTCQRNYRITVQELTKYRSLRLPVPRRCFNCRHAERLRRRGPLELFDRSCAKCGSPVRTSLREEAAPIVYCNTCYTDAIA